MVGASTLLKSSVTGGVVGLGVRDAVGGAISLGKTSRGATESQRYHFGDVSRGVMAAASLAAKKGSSDRGRTEYQVGDFASGASSASAEYVSRNRERLGGAVGTSTAMLVGAAALGPVGLVAGAIIGGRAGKEAVKATVGEYKGHKDPASGPQGQPPSDPFHSSSYQEQLAADQRRRTEPPQMTNISQAQTPANDDPFAIISISEKPSASRASTAITRQPFAAEVADPFSVFDSPTPKPPPPAYEAPPDDPLAFLAGPEPPKTTTPHQRHSTAEVNRGQPMNQHAPVPQQRQQAYPAQQGATHRNLPMGQPRHYPTAPPQQAPMHAAHPQHVSHAAQRPKKGYKFGDVTRGLIAKGKEKRGDSGSDYKVRCMLKVGADKWKLTSISHVWTCPTVWRLYQGTVWLADGISASECSLVDKTHARSVFTALFGLFDRVLEATLTVTKHVRDIAMHNHKIVRRRRDIIFHRPKGKSTCCAYAYHSSVVIPQCSLVGVNVISHATAAVGI